MAILNVLVYPDPRLRMRAEPVQTVTDDVRRLVDDMAETMYAAPGIGLAAIQVNVPLRVIVIDIAETRDDLLVLIDPELLELEGEQACEEGCLSVPGVYAEVTRARRVRVKALGRDGKVFELDADGMLAVCIQHEIDHLDGKVFVDYLSRMKRERIKKRLLKEARRAPQPPVPAAL